MKSWHIGLVVALVIAYLVGAKYPSLANSIFAKF